MCIDANLLHRRLATLQSNYISSTSSEQQHPLPWPKCEVSSSLAEVYHGRGFGEEWCNAKLSPETPRQELIFGINLSVECLHQDPQNNLHTCIRGEVVTWDLGMYVHTTGLLCCGVLWWPPPCALSTTAIPYQTTGNGKHQTFLWSYALQNTLLFQNG